MTEKRFSQEELNRIVTARLKRERERLTKDFEKRLKRCMASIHLMLYQEIGAMKWELAAETKDTLLSAEADKQPAIPAGADLK